MSDWIIFHDDKRTTYRDEKQTLQVEQGMCAIDFLEVDWQAVIDDLSQVKGDTTGNVIIHNRLNKPDEAIYYQLAAWAHRTVERIREIDPVYAKNVFEWLKYEIERPYLMAYRGADESFGGDDFWDKDENGVMRLRLKDREDIAEFQEEMWEYVDNVRPSAEFQMAVQWIVRFVDLYPAFPPFMRFKTDDSLVQQYIGSDGKLDYDELAWKRNLSEAEEKLMLESLSTANMYDETLNKVTKQSIKRLLDKLKPLKKDQVYLEELIGYVLDADGVPTVEEADKRIKELPTMEAYRKLQGTRGAVDRAKAYLQNMDVTDYQFSPVLIVLNEFNWMCAHRKRKLRKCGHCGRYFISNSPKAAFCERLLESGDETCREFENRLKQESPDLQELERIHESARDSYRRRLRNAPNRGTEKGKKQEQEYEIWKKAAMAQRDAAMRGEISAEKLRKVLSYDNHEKLIAAWKRMEYEGAKAAFADSDAASL